MAVEQDWVAYADQGYLAETDTLLARTQAGAGVELPGIAVIAKRGAGTQYQARGSIRFNGYGGTEAAPTELFDWPVPVVNIVGYGNFTLQTMLAFTLPNDGNSFTGSSVWNFKLEQIASSISSAGTNVKGMQFGGPGYLALLPQNGPVTVNGISSDLGGSIVGSGIFRVAASGGYSISTWHSADYTAVQFVRAGAQVGTIICNASGTAFNTTSDQRLKDDDGLIDVADASAIMRLIAIHRFRWKSTGEKDIGAFAQELHKIYPRAVTPGDAETPWYVDYSALVPVMAAAWQDADARLSALEALSA